MLPFLSPAFTSYSSPPGHLGLQDEFQGLAYKVFLDLAPAGSPELFPWAPDSDPLLWLRGSQLEGLVPPGTTWPAWESFWLSQWELLLAPRGKLLNILERTGQPP